MDRETANQLADELIKNERASAAESSVTAREEKRLVSVSHFILPIILTSLITWFVLSVGGAGLLAVAIGSGTGVVISHIALKHFT